MAVYFLHSFVLLTCLMAGCINGQQRISFSLQAALNEFCKSHSSHTGCFLRPPKADAIGPEGCPVSTRRCQRKDEETCLPEHLTCDLLGSNESCQLPFGEDFTVQTVFCGRGKIGDSCNVNNRVPVLTVIAVQCNQQQHKTNAFLSVINLQSYQFQQENGAGIYRCLPGNQWEAVYENSPFFNSLLRSCYTANCGHLPTPAGDQAPNQHWPWLRQLMDNQRNVLCTATLVSSDTLVTAAHCVTRSLTSTEPIDTALRIVSIPLGDIVQNTRIQSINIHPNYRAGDLRENDIALIKFSNEDAIYRPHACLSFTVLQDTTPAGLIFKYDQFFNNWTLSDALYSSTCRSSQARLCNTIAPAGQFCAMQSRVQLEPRSSGSPYLVNIQASTLDFTWAVHGIYSREHRASSSCNFNYVYVKLEQHLDWLIQCLFNDFCR